MHDVFISHSRTYDREIADAVVATLETNGIRCWIAPRDIKVGEDFASAIVQAISNTRVLVLIFSSHANDSIHIRREVDAALRRGAVVVPFRVENVMPEGALAYHLQSLQWLDALTPDIDRHIQDLARAVKEELAQTSTPRTPTTDFGRLTPITPHPAFKPVSATYPAVATPRTGEMAIPASPSASPVAPARRWIRPSRNLLAGVSLAVFAALVVTRFASGSAEVVGVSFAHPGAPGSSGPLHLTVERMRFFEGPFTPPVTAERGYATSFSPATTRFVYTELTFAYPPLDQPITVTVSCTVAGHSGSSIGQFVVESALPAGSTRWINARAWGRAEPGGWVKGVFRVDCSSGETLVARGAFEITE